MNLPDRGDDEPLTRGGLHDVAQFGCPLQFDVPGGLRLGCGFVLSGAAVVADGLLFGVVAVPENRPTSGNGYH